MGYASLPTPNETPIERFRRYAGMRRDVPCLWEAAFAVAEIEFPNADAEPYSELLDVFADQLKEALSDGVDDPEDFVSIYHPMFFTEWGFHGNDEDYYNPGNSFLNRVIDNRTGIPISLTVIYAEVARRAGFPVHGINFPSHFLAAVGETDPLYVDVFNGGKLVTDRDCREMIREYAGQEPGQLNVWRRRASNQATVARMLNNLKTIYFSRSDYPRMMDVLDRLLLLNPDDLCERKTRGLLNLRMGRMTRAREDLMAWAARHDDEEETREVLALLAPTEGFGGVN
ncbi:MAG: hypothetical protein GMKNLPBB_01093 [Myxococcota bacterium]|nr:hypothetical protein [Myxococcota bacterium]